MFHALRKPDLGTWVFSPFRYVQGLYNLFEKPIVSVSSGANFTRYRHFVGPQHAAALGLPSTTFPLHGE